MSLTQRGRVAKWSKEQIAQLSTPELKQLRDNAERLNEAEVVALCSELIEARPKRAAPGAKKAAR
jgi:hypothetical protein